jgi:hypothetical protein
MPVPNKPIRGQADWDTPLNAALDYLDARIDEVSLGYLNISGGSASSIYLNDQSIDGGTAGSF